MEHITKKTKKTTQFLAVIFITLKLGVSIERYYKHYLKNKYLFVFIIYLTDFMIHTLLHQRNSIVKVPFSHPNKFPNFEESIL